MENTSAVLLYTFLPGALYQSRTQQHRGDIISLGQIRYAAFNLNNNSHCYARVCVFFFFLYILFSLRKKTHISLVECA